MCFGNSAAKRQARATEKAAADQAKADREAAVALQQGRETMIAQARAAERASELLNVPMEQAEVDLAPETNNPVDPVTGRRRPARARFMSQRRTSGIAI